MFVWQAQQRQQLLQGMAIYSEITEHHLVYEQFIPLDRGLRTGNVRLSSPDPKQGTDWKDAIGSQQSRWCWFDSSAITSGLQSARALTWFTTSLLGLDNVCMNEIRIKPILSFWIRGKHSQHRFYDQPQSGQRIGIASTDQFPSRQSNGSVSLNLVPIHPLKNRILARLSSRSGSWRICQGITN